MKCPDVTTLSPLVASLQLLLSTGHNISRLLSILPIVLNFVWSPTVCAGDPFSSAEQVTTRAKQNISVTSNPAPATTSANQTPANPHSSEKPASEYWLGGGAGGSKYRLKATAATVSGEDARVGLIAMKSKAGVLYLVSADGVACHQKVSEVAPQTPVVVAKGSGYRDALVGIAQVGLGYRSDKIKVHPYVFVLGGLAIGHEDLRIDLELSTTTTATALGTFYGYYLNQGLTDRGIVLSPSVGAELGIMPLSFKNHRVVVGLALTSWPSAKNASAGIVLRYFWRYPK